MKIIIPGEPEKGPELSLGAQWFAHETARVLENTMKFEAFRRVAELRKSAGVESQKVNIKVNLPPRYGKKS